MRKYAPYADAAKARGMRIFPLNIGQPDIETPAAFFEAVRNFSAPVLEYAPSDGVAEYLEALVAYYHRLGHTDLTRANVLASNGGSEALWMTMAAIMDDGDEIIVPEPYYPNYSTFITLAGGRRAAHPDRARDRLPLRRPREDCLADYPPHPRAHDYEPRQPHGRGADARGDEDARRALP